MKKLMIFILISLFLMACGSNEKHSYKGSVNEMYYSDKNSNYPKSQIDHKDVEAIIETVDKHKSRLFLNSKDGLKLGECQQPLEVSWIEDKKQASISTCKRIGTSEIRNIGFSTIRLDGQKIEINLHIDDYTYDFRGTEIGK